MSITFYSSPMTSATPVAWALAELNVPHETVILDLAAGDQRKPEFLALNPHGKVPTLVVDGAPLFEGLAIMQWLGDHFGVESKLWPASGTPARLAALSWTTWAYATLSPSIRVFIRSGSDRVPAELHHPPLKKHALEEIDGLLAVLDAHLAKSQYIIGDELSLADVIVGSVVGFGAFVGVPIAGHSHLKVWFESFQARPAFRAAWGASA